MKLADVVIGGRYTARISGRLVPVTVIRKLEPIRSSPVTRFEIRNERTGRTTHATAARLREPLMSKEQLQYHLGRLRAAIANATIVMDAAHEAAIAEDADRMRLDAAIVRAGGKSCFAEQD